MAQFIGENTGGLLAEAKRTGRSKKTYFKNGARIRRSVKHESNGMMLHEQVDFACAGKEGIIADKHEPIPV